MMFVRWKRYQGQRWWRPAGAWLEAEHRHAAYNETPGITHRAYLVRSVRVEGRVRQRVVCYLGSITDYRIAYGSAGHRAGFWEQARRKLNSIDLPPEARAHCEAQLAAVVPEPTEAETRAADEAAKAAKATLRAFGLR